MQNYPNCDVTRKIRESEYSCQMQGKKDPTTDTNKTHTGRESKPGSKVASANHNTLFTLHPGSRLQPPIRGWFTEKEQTENRSGIIQENVQPPGLKVWSDPFSRK
uniref:Small integral membrane protein 20 isoform X2 n=1 Tax=Geotrypetes seraphini TaxID=260995 RepID=A0A6P8RJR9_GEOSA|nr:small integral membrane protein 20 isoform X2 [Geotrypetes seraphini]